MKEKEVAIVIAADYVSVVMRMSVNEIIDAEWFSYALMQAYQSAYGDKYASEMSDLYDSIDIEYNDALLEQLTLENYLIEVYE